MHDDDLVPLFMPALCTLLMRAEDTLGRPLDEAEALQIRDQASVIMVARDHAAQMAQSRGYADIDPENCWYDWQMLRRELGRKPDLDPGARVSFVSDADADFVATIQQARNTLPAFRRLLLKLSETATPLVKALLEDAAHRAYIWLIITAFDDNGFVGEIFELPHAFSEFEVGQEIAVADVDIMDWMVNDAGVLHGGYSLRLTRSRLPAAEQEGFDQHLGVHTYL